MTVDYRHLPDILVFNRQLEIIDRISADVYVYWRYERKLREPDSFEFQINKNVPKAKTVLDSSAFALGYFDGVSTRVGIIEQIECSTDEDGMSSEVLRVTGRSGGMLAERICLADTATGTGYDEQSGDAETVLRHYVDVNCINAVDGAGADASYRVIPNFRLETTNQHRGKNVSYSARFDVLSDVLTDLCFSGDIGWEVLFDIDAREFVFTVIEGTSHTSSDPFRVIFKPGLNTVNGLDYKYSLLGSKSLCYVGAGDADAENRTVVAVYIDSQQPSGYDLREMFSDQRNTDDVVTLTSAGVAKLIEAIGEHSISAEIISLASLQYQQDYDLGDIVTVDYPDIAVVDVRIIGVVDEVIEGDRGDCRMVTISLGTEAPDIRRMVRKTMKNTKEEMK